MGQVGDPIASVEAAYRVETDLDTWARGIVEATAPQLDAGFGVVGYLIRAPARYSLLEVGAGPLPDGALQAVHDMSAVEDIQSLLYRPQVATISELLSPAAARKLLAASWWGQFGIQDAMGIVAPADTEHFFVVSVPLPKTTTVSARVRQRMARYAAHIGAALRLRGATLREVAVVTPDGYVEHAEGAAREKPALEALRQRAVAIDLARSKMRRRNADEALSIWKGLLNGRWSLVERFERDGRRYYVACENPLEGRGPRSLTARERQVVELTARGHGNKLSAYTLGITEAATSIHLRHALVKLGVRTRAELKVLAKALA